MPEGRGLHSSCGLPVPHCRAPILAHGRAPLMLARPTHCINRHAARESFLAALLNKAATHSDARLTGKAQRAGASRAGSGTPRAGGSDCSLSEAMVWRRRAAPHHYLQNTWMSIESLLDEP